eukprot:PRCOL_00006339-RA
MLRFEGARHFRARLLAACLTGRGIRIDRIREAAATPGLRTHEASMLRLLEKVLVGAEVVINETGTSLTFRPGLMGGGAVSHACSGRAIGYFLEPLVALALFGKKELRATLKGVTNDDVDVSVDAVRMALLPLVRRFGVEERVELEVRSRGCWPAGGGEVALRVPPARALRPLELTEEGLVKRVRGVAYACRVSPQMANRMAGAARGVLNRLLPDVFIVTDHAKGATGGASAGYGVLLLAETTAGVTYCVEVAASPRADASGTAGGGGAGGAQHGGEMEAPEDLGKVAAEQLLEEIARGGCVDSERQPFVLTLAAACPGGASRLRLGPLSEQAVEMLRILRDVMGVTYRLDAEPNTKTVIAACVGAGVKNAAARYH